jgi:ribosomal protein L6P/L9E
MLSIQVPSTIKIYAYKDFIKIKGPNGFFIKKINFSRFKFNVINTFYGSRIFINTLNSKNKKIPVIFSQLNKFFIGLSSGYRQRLRLFGIGFRAVLNPYTEITNKSNIKVPNYNLKRMENYINTISDKKLISNKIQKLTLKLGFSHESEFYFYSYQNSKINVSRLDSRSKGTVISIYGTTQSYVNQVASEIRCYRKPNIYIGKGIHFDGEILKLKKGKQQA